MKKIIRLTETDLYRIVKRVIKENEENWIEDSDEIENEIDLNKIKVPREIANNRHFEKLVKFFKNNPDVADEVQDELDYTLNEEYEYKDYSDTKPKNISGKEYWVRKLTLLGFSALAGALIAIPMSGGLGADDILQMALGMAAGTAVLSDTLISNVNRKKIK